MANRQHKYKSDEVNEFGEYIKIGGSPMPGVTLKKILQGHKATITHITWSPDGRYLASPSFDSTMRIWDVQHEECIAVLQRPEHELASFAWSPDGKEAIGSSGESVSIWDTATWQVRHTFKARGIILCTDWALLTNKIAFGFLGRTIDILDISTYQKEISLIGNSNFVLNIAWSPDGKMLASATGDNKVTVWNTETGTIDKVLGKSGKGPNIAITWHKNQPLIISGSTDATVNVWDLETGKLQQSLEGHTGAITSISLSRDARFLASKSLDHTIRLWQTDTWETVALIEERSFGGYFGSVSFHPNLLRLATLGENDTAIRIWDIAYDELKKNQSIPESVRYTTAKIVLVGDSGVGKTGLGWRLAHDEFKEHASTHGQQFWIIPELGIKRKDGTECEAVLWDLAGQHSYRTIHSIFLEKVDASLILFDANNHQSPLKGVEFWLNQLAGKNKLPPSVLVGARCDVSPTILSKGELDQFCQKYEITGNYVSTSAKTGEGLDKLLEILKAQIPWNEMTATVTTVTFKRIKEYVLMLKEMTSRKSVLIRPEELQDLLQLSDKGWQFTNDEMMIAIGHLENHGFVTILHSSSGEEYILLAPDLLVDVAASIVLLADKHAKELGAINETELLQGKYKLDVLEGLKREEQHILLDAAVLRFLEHNICFRETFGNDTLLIFPNLIQQKRPLHDDFKSVDDVSYIVRGRVENVYASLVVLLGYTTIFTRINQWQNQAQYEMGEGEVCGFRLIEDREGEIELVLYYSLIMPNYGRIMFQGLFESFLYRRDVDVIRYPPVYCLNKHLLQRAAVIKRVREGKNYIFCDECGVKTNLPDIENPSEFERKETHEIQRSESMAQLRSSYETYLVRVKSFRRDRSAPRCYISYVDNDSPWVKQLIHDLLDAGVQIINGQEFIDDGDLILITDTPAYQANPIQADLAMAKKWLERGKHSSIIRLQIEGKLGPEEGHQLSIGDMRPLTRYPVALFDLILRLYSISFNHPVFGPLRYSLHQQWERSLGKLKNDYEIYISYAWGGESEKLVDDLDQAFQKRGVTIVRDKRDLGFKGRIRSFMETIGKGKAVILVISDRYLKSENCMFELLEVAKYGEFAARIFPVVLRDANIYKAKDRVVYVQYWQQQIDELETVMKGGSVANLQGIQDDLNLYTEIRANIARLTDVLRDMNTLTPEIHEKSAYSAIFNAVMASLEA